MMPLIALGAAAGIIPIVVHLLHRQKTVPIAWGAMQFLVDAPCKQQRRERLDHWLLLLCRMALLILLAFMLARPLILASKYNPLATNTATDIAVVVDHSLSMGRRGGEQTLFEQALAQTGKIAGMMRKDDSLSIVLAEHTPRCLTARPVVGAANVGKLLDALRQEVKPNTGLTDGPVPDAVQAARNLVNHGGNIRKLIFVLTDEQRSGWLIDNHTAWRNALGGLAGLDRAVEVYAWPVTGTLTSPNISVSALNLAPGFLGVGRPVQITATVANAGPGVMGAIPLALVVDGRAAGRQEITGLAAGQAQTIRFEHVFTEPGAHWLKVQAEVVDALEADNAVLAAVHVWPKLPVLIIDGQLGTGGGFRGSAFLRAALAPSDSDRGGSSLVETRVVGAVEAAATPLSGYSAVIVNDVPELPQDVVSHLTDFALAGHGVWFIVGHQANPAFFNDTLAKSALFPVRLKEPQTPATPAGVDVKDPASPMVAVLTAAERNAFTGVALHQWWAVEPLNADTRVVLAVSNGDPLVLEHRLGGNGGRVAIWTTSVDGQSNNLPLATNFLPLVYETLYHLASGQAKNMNRRLECGASIYWSGPSAPALQSATVTLPDAGVHQAQPVLSTDGKWIVSYSNTYTPGLYELRFSPSTIPQPVYYSVNVDRLELDPATLAPSDVSWLQENGYLKDHITEATLAAAIGAENRGTELWPSLALGLLGLLVLETFLTRRIVRLQVQEKTPGLPGVGGRA